MNMSNSPSPAPFRSKLQDSARILAPLALLLVAGGTGCFRATGLSRPAVAVEEIPAVGGDRVVGLKATAGTGDFYIGNDAAALAVDGAVFGNREGQFGAASGGAILDVGSISLDQSYHRVSMPTDMVERLGPVANQDPELPLVFDHYSPTSAGGETGGAVVLAMTGYLLDPKGKLGVARDTQGRVSGVTVVHSISQGNNENFFTLETTLTNASGTTLPLRNLGDYLSQHGGGLRFNIPARTAFDGTPLSNWGVEIPGSDFNAPLTSSVVAPMVGLMGAESSGDTLDSHSSLGIMPLDVDTLLVASDPQHALTELRPTFPARLVVGSPAVASLPSGASLIYRRRLYVLGGSSITSSLPAEATVVFSEMAQARGTLRNEDVGYFSFTAFGTAAPDTILGTAVPGGGPLQTEFRFEQYTGSAADPTTDPSNWLLQRVEWHEPMDLSTGATATGLYLPVGTPQRYRIISRNALQQSAPLYFGTNAADTTRPNLVTPLLLSRTQNWRLAEPLSPERDEVLDTSGNVIKKKRTVHGFYARQLGTLEDAGMNPLRITFFGVGNPDPSVQRMRRLSSTYSPVYKAKAPVNLTAGNLGQYQYTAGNQIFGTAFGYVASAAAMYFAPGNYIAYAARGPMSNLDTLPVKAFDGQTDVWHEFLVAPPTLPTGWTSFDLPAPTQTTTGGFNPGEMLSSALSEGVEIVARTEVDLLTDPTALRTEFRAEIDIPSVTALQKAPIGNNPFIIGARSSSLSDGFTTALFIPTPTTDRNGGARPSKGWNLADFITQAEGSYTVVHRPRGPQGLFTLRGFDRTVALGTGTNAWWNLTGPLALGKKLGDFDAIELLRAEGCNPADPTAWYAEYSTLRDDWFALLKQQKPGAFTKGLGLSAATFSLDTPVGLSRTYLNIGTTTSTLIQDGTLPVLTELAPVLTALQSGAAVASTGPLVLATANGVGPGGLVTGTNASVSLSISLYAPDWLPVDEVRVVVNGAAPLPVPLASFVTDATDSRLRKATLTVPMPAGKDAWLVVEAGVSRTQTGPYQVGTPWNKLMRGIYPIAITNPIFVDVDGGGYTPPGL